MTIAIGKWIEDISLNGPEFLLDDEGTMLEFDSEESGKKYLIDRGIPEDTIQADLDSGAIFFIEDTDDMYGWNREAEA